MPHPIKALVFALLYQPKYEWSAALDHYLAIVKER
jgi:hypothetical protein